MTNELLQGKPKKLRDDTWGAWVDGRPAPGERIMMVSNSDKRWNAYVGKVIWQGDDGAICSLEERGASNPRRGRTDAGGSNDAPVKAAQDSGPPPSDWGDEKDYRSS